MVYNISLRDLNLTHNNIPFALKFSTKEGLTPTPSRESLILTEGTKQKIKDKLRDALIELYEYYPKNNVPLWEYFLNPQLITVPIGDVNLSLDRDINRLCLSLGCPQFIQVNPVFSEIDMSGLKHWFFSDLTRDRTVYANGIKVGSVFNIRGQGIVFSDTISGPISRYLREKYLNYYLFRDKKRKLWGSSGYYSIFGLKNIPRNKWRTIISEWIKEQKVFLDTKVQFDQSDYKDWLSKQPRTKSIRYKKKDEEIKVWNIIKTARNILRFIPEHIIIKDSKWFIYTTDRQHPSLHYLVNNNFNCKLINPSDVPKLKGRKFISVDDFLKSKGHIRLVNNSYLSGFSYRRNDFYFPGLYEHLFKTYKRTLFGYPRNLIWEFNKDTVIKSQGLKNNYSSRSHIEWRDNKIKRLELEIKKLKQRDK